MITVTEVEDRVRVSMTDCGIGIALDALDGIFGKFFRVRTTATRAIDGTRLGLALSRKIIEEHGGHDRVRERRRRGLDVLVSSSLWPAERRPSTNDLASTPPG